MARGGYCPHSGHYRHGHHNSSEHRYRYQCKKCGKYFDDLTNTIFQGHHQPLKVWVICLYLMGLNLSNKQIAAELGLNESDCHAMTSLLGEGVYEKKPKVTLSGEVEIDELYVIAGHKGNPEAVKKKRRKGSRRRLKGKRGRGTAQDDKPPILGMIQRGGLVRIHMLDNVQRKTIEPIIRAEAQIGTKVLTDEYNIYNWVSKVYDHKTVNHGQGEYARDEDGDGKFEVHVNTMEGFWSLLRSWLRPHRGISQERLPFYLGFFEFLHNIRKRGRNALTGLMTLLLTT
jgi:transposase-like protein